MLGRSQTQPPFFWIYSIMPLYYSTIDTSVLQRVDKMSVVYLANGGSSRAVIVLIMLSNSPHNASDIVEF